MGLKLGGNLFCPVKSKKKRSKANLFGLTAISFYLSERNNPQRNLKIKLRIARRIVSI